VLNAYVAKARGPVGLVRLLLTALFRRLDTANAREFETVCASTLRIGLHRRKLPVSIDGEVVRLDPPLRYRIRPGGLRVLAPRVAGETPAGGATSGDAAGAPAAVAAAPAMAPGGTA
jgi:diacylglycerol kinase family enzyme